MRRLNDPLNRRLNRRLDRYTTHMLFGRRPAPPNYLAMANCLINAAIRSHKRLINLSSSMFASAHGGRKYRKLEAERQRDQELLRRVKAAL
jgi:hypothetical protein